MKTAALLLLALAFISVTQAGPLMLQPVQTIYAGATPLDPGDYAIPCVTDWNGDGKKDLIVGYRYADKIAVYLNCGTDAQPAFTNFFNLQAGGADIYQAGSSCGAPAPWVCDYDADGDRDLLVGNGANGYVYFYCNTNTDAQPILAPGVALTVGGNPLSVSWRATPYVHDWDEDGLKDLLCGNGDGNVYFFKNIGSAQSPTYTNFVLLSAGGTTLNFGARSVVRVFDWDGDGPKDLVGSSSTGVYWCRNTNNSAAPSLQAKVAICAPVSGSGLVPINTSARMRLDLVDWNNDGVMDLLLGNVDGTVSIYEGYRFFLTSLSLQPGSQCVLEWNSAPFLKYNLLAGPSLDNLVGLVATNLPSGGKSTRWTNAVAGESQFFRVQLAQ